MDLKAAHDQRIAFSARLKQTLVDIGMSTSVSQFTRSYNARADGAAVSIHAARKWLVGEAIPTHEKVVILATWLGVSPSWLLFGETFPPVRNHTVLPEAEVSTPALALANDVSSLTQREQRMVREIVDIFLRNRR